MRVHFSTIVLDGMPWISLHYAMLRTLPFEWEWTICEGVAAAQNCTKWCHQLEPRLSNDGTTQYLDSLAFDARVHVYRKPMWNGKIEMVNAAVAQIQEKCLLWEIDSDEIWTAEQVARMRRLFMACPERNAAQFYCRYFVGPDIVTVGKGVFGNFAHDWERVWRFEPGMKFESHEPPRLNLGAPKVLFTQEETAAQGLVFDHFAYATEAAVSFKEKYYGANGANTGHYKNAVADWRRLQANQNWPVRLKQFLPWVDEQVMARRI